MKRLIISFLLTLSLPAAAQQLLKRPLEYVPADSVFVLPQGDHNVILDIMAVAPFAGPHDITVDKDDRRAARQRLKARTGTGQASAAESLTATERITQHAKMLLLTGHACYAETLDEGYFRRLPQALHDDGILPRSEREAAAQQLLDLTGTIFATDGRREVYVNFFENCVARIHTRHFRMQLDMVSEYPDGPKVKLRIDGLKQSLTPFALHIRLPEKGKPDKFYINGHEIIRPVCRDGYLVIDRKWRNGEEVFFITE